MTLEGDEPLSILPTNTHGATYPMPVMKIEAKIKFWGRIALLTGAVLPSILNHEGASPGLTQTCP